LAITYVLNTQMGHASPFNTSAFQWYKELFNPISFDPYNCLLKIQEFVNILIPKVGVHLKMWGFIPSHFPTLPGAWNVTPRLHSLPTPLQALALVMSPRLGLWQSPNPFENYPKSTIVPTIKIWKKLLKY
jgi:hypothetical protein